MNRQFTALSGIAMILIVLNHAIQLGIEYPLQLGADPLPDAARASLSVLQALGVFAVPIFLFISGSFVAYAAQGDPPKLTSKFLFTSLRHILVPYVLWSILFYIVIWFHRGEQYSLVEYIRFLLVGYPFHFVPLLAVFYLAAPLLVRIGKRFPIALILVIALYQLLLLNLVYPGSLGIDFPGWINVLAPPVLRQTMADWAVFFPLGMVYGLHARQYQPVLKRLAPFLWMLTAGFFVVGIVGRFFSFNFLLARHVCMFTFVLVIPSIQRDAIPWAKELERIGRRSYGLYLMHLIIIDLVLFGIELTVRGLLDLPLLLFPLLFVVGIWAPLILMEGAANASFKKYYRFVFG